VNGRTLGVLAALAQLAACSGEVPPSAQAQTIEPEDPAPRAVPVPPPAPALARDVAIDAAIAPVAVPARPEHDVWHLGPNRHLAHLVVGGDLVIDAGAPGFARYTRFGLPVARWRYRVEVDGEPTAVPRKHAALDLPLTAAQAASATTLRLRVHSAKPTTLTLGLGGKRLARVLLAAGWQDLAIAATFRVGENLLAIASDDTVHVRWIAATRGDPPPPAPIGRARWSGAAGGFVLADRAGLAWYVLVPDGAALAADVAGAGPQCAVDVHAEDGDGARVRGRLAGPGARIDLSPLAGSVVRLELAARGCARGVMVADGRITVPGAAAPPGPDGEPPRLVILWVMDALRADRVATFTPGARAQTPNLDRLAETGAVFRQHYVGGNESQVSHATMFTGLYPAVHTVRTAGRDQRYRIPRRFPTIGRRLRDAGYATIGVTANGFVDEYGGYSRGFAEYRNLMNEKGVKNAAIRGRVILEDALARIERHADDPTFTFIGTIDTHSPLIARDPWIERYDPGRYDGPFERATTAGPLGIYAGQMGCHKVPPEREIVRMRAIYDSAISYQDALIGELLDALERLGLADRTMLVITADHGEELFEEHRCGHGATLRESLVRVPLLVHYPPRVAPRVVDEGTEGVDVLPTILDAIGAPVDGIQGRSLRGLAAGEGAGWPRPAFASQYEYAFAMRLGRWKARVGKTGRPMVFDLDEDPLERVDLAAARPLERRYLTDHLALYLAFRTGWTKATWGVASNMSERGAWEMER